MVGCFESTERYFLCQKRSVLFGVRSIYCTSDQIITCTHRTLRIHAFFSLVCARLPVALLRKTGSRLLCWHLQTVVWRYFHLSSTFPEDTAPHRRLQNGKLWWTHIGGNSEGNAKRSISLSKSGCHFFAAAILCQFHVTVSSLMSPLTLSDGKNWK